MPTNSQWQIQYDGGLMSWTPWWTNSYFCRTLIVRWETRNFGRKYLFTTTTKRCELDKAKNTKILLTLLLICCFSCHRSPAEKQAEPILFNITFKDELVLLSCVLDLSLRKLVISMVINANRWAPQITFSASIEFQQNRIIGQINLWTLVEKNINCFRAFLMRMKRKKFEIKYVCYSVFLLIFSFLSLSCQLIL